MHIKIYTKTVCPYCVAAKSWLRGKGYEYEEVTLDDDGERQKFYEEVGSGVKTVPQIFVDGERIGGYTDLVKSRLATANVENLDF
jgi:glutaredoxin 3